LKLRLPDVVAALDVTVRDQAQLPAEFGVCTDTRSLQEGELFVALRGANFDGHAFVREARARGACGAVVDDAGALPEGMPGCVVIDTTRAYLDLAGAARRRLHARVVAITGSTGKTTTKSLLAQLLSQVSSEKVAATPANENNEIGVAKLFLSLDEDVDIVVVELGARHFGELVPLVRIAWPDVAVITNIGDAHLEIMGSRERLAQTKFDIFATGAQPILRRDDVESRRLAAGLSRMPEWFDVVRLRGDLDTERPRFTTALVEYVDHAGVSLLHYGADEPPSGGPVDLRLPGYHTRWNLAAAAAAADALGKPMEAIAAAVSRLTLPAGRYERSRIGEIEIIFDAYNASMSGTLAVLESFASEAAQRRIAVLGSMAELGDDAPAMHKRVGASAAAANVDVLLVGGNFADDLARGAREEGLAPARIVHFASNDDAVVWLRAGTRPGDLVLFKGSRMYKLEEIVEGLRLART
jgi:UDP-N-acetylmuramoyl-tripeptide--D-alanyl-D-alanine ligase